MRIGKPKLIIPLEDFLFLVEWADNGIENSEWADITPDLSKERARLKKLKDKYD